MATQPKNTTYLAFIHAHLPACSLAEPEVVDTQDPSRIRLQVRCKAPDHLRCAMGYPGLCPHAGPYLYGDEERLEDTQSCQILNFLKNRR